MAKQQRSKKRGVAQDTSLPLRGVDGTPFLAFPEEAVDHYRRMITGLTHRSDFPDRVAVIAALSKEGVTYTSLALATTLASDMAVSVCAVELNWRSPGMQAHLSPASPKQKAAKQKSRRQTPALDETSTASSGLAAVLMGTASLDEALIQTELPNLALLPAGDMPLLQCPAMARSEGLRACIDTLGQRFDHIILDIPAIHATSDAIALASLAPACCLVIQQGVTPVTKVRTALDEVKHLQMLGVVLNKVRIHTPRWIRDFIPQG